MAQYQREKKKYYYMLKNGRFDKVDGEPKTWDLAKFVKEELTANETVRKNLELTIALRNKIEHRYEEAITVATAGYSQSLLLNYEERLTTVFGNDESLGSELRFPIFVGTLTKEGARGLAAMKSQLSKKMRDFLINFETGINASVIQDYRYEFRVHLVPKIGSKSEADLAVTFVRQEDLSPAQRDTLSNLGNDATVIIREQVRNIVSENLLKPTAVAQAVEVRISYKFQVKHVTRIWQTMKLRPPGNDEYPERTIQDYCIYDRPHRDYLYTEAFVEFAVTHAQNADDFRKLTGFEAELKVAE